MDVHVDEPGEERFAGKVDMLRSSGDLHRREAADLLDAAVVADEDRGVIDIAAAGDVQHPVGGYHRCGLRRYGAEKGRAGSQNPRLHCMPTPRNPVIAADLRAHAREALHSCAAHNACWADCNIIVAPHRTEPNV